MWKPTRSSRQTRPGAERRLTLESLGDCASPLRGLARMTGPRRWSTDGPKPEPGTTSRPSPKVRHSGGKACKIAVRERGGRAEFRPPRRNGSMAAAKKIGILTGGGDVPG